MAESTTPTPYDYDPDAYNQQLKDIAPSLYDAGIAAQDQLKKPAGIWDDEKFAKITAHLREPAVDAAQQSLDSLKQQQRATGMTVADSTRGAKAIYQQESKNQRQIADNIDVPLILEQLRQRDTAERASIQQAADIGVQQSQTALAAASITGTYGGNETMAKEKQASDLRLAEAAATGYLTLEDVSANSLGIDLQAYASIDKRKAAIAAAAPYLSQAQVSEIAYGNSTRGQVITLSKDQQTYLQNYQDKQQDIDTRLAEAGLLGDYTDANGVEHKGVTLDAKQLELKKTNDEVTRAIQEASQTGEFIVKDEESPYYGQSVATLQSWQIQMAEAAMTGKYTGRYGLDEGSETLAAKMQMWDQTSRDKAIFGYDQTTTDENGNLVTLKGEDGKPIHVYGSNELQMVLQNDTQEFSKLMNQGYSYVDEDGATRRVLGVDERAQADFDRTEAARTGYDEGIPDPNKPGEFQKDSSGNIIMRHVEGTQESSVRLAEREADLREKGLDAETAHQTAILEQNTRQYEGYSKIRTFTAKDMGFEGGAAALQKSLVEAGVMNTDGGLTTGAYDKFFVWADAPANGEVYNRIKAFLGGNAPSMDQLSDILSGGAVAMVDEDGNPRVDFINGTVGLQTERLEMEKTLQKNGFTQATAERTAAQAYNEKVTAGYWTTVRDGTGQPRQRYVRGTQTQDEYMTTLQNTLGITADKARFKLQEQARVGYEQVYEYPPDSGNFQQVHVKGTQEYASSENDLERQLKKDLQENGFTQQESERIASEEYSEEVRLGHWVERETADGRPVRVWVGGTEDFAQGQQDQADALVVKGWGETAARQRTEIAANNAAQFGGWTQVTDAHGNMSLSYVKGTIQAQKHLQDLANDFEEKGWAHDDAVRAAEYIQSQATDNLGYLQQNYIDERVWFYESQGMSTGEAADAAMSDWNGDGTEANPGAKAAFGGQMEVVLAQMNIDAADARLDAQAVQDRNNALIGKVTQLGGNLLTYLFTPSSDGSTLGTALSLASVAGSAITGADVMRMASERGTGTNLTQAEADDIAAAFPSGGLPLPQKTPFAKMGTWVAAGTTKFGTWITGGAATGGTALAVGAAGIAAVAYGAYKLIDWWKSNSAKDEENKEGFDDYVDSLPSDDYNAIRYDIINGQSSLNWDMRHDVFARLNKALEKDDPLEWLKSSEDYNPVNKNASAQTLKAFELTQAAIDMYQYQPTKSFQSLSENMRSLLDKDFFDREKVDTMTVSDRAKLIDIWKKMPAQARTKDLPDYVANNPNEAQLTAIMGDVATFRVGMGIFSTEEMGEAMNGLVSSGALDKDETDLTVAELGVIDQLAKQNGIATNLRIWEKQDALKGALPADMFTQTTGHEGWVPPAGTQMEDGRVSNGDGTYVPAPWDWEQTTGTGTGTTGGDTGGGSTGTGSSAYDSLMSSRLDNKMNVDASGNNIWTAANVEAIRADLQSGKLTPGDIERLMISREKKDHLLQGYTPPPATSSKPAGSFQDAGTVQPDGTVADGNGGFVPGPTDTTGHETTEPPTEPPAEPETPLKNIADLKGTDLGGGVAVSQTIIGWGTLSSAERIAAVTSYQDKAEAAGFPRPTVAQIENFLGKKISDPLEGAADTTQPQAPAKTPAEYGLPSNWAALQKLDNGGSWVFRNSTGHTVGEVPKDVYNTWLSSGGGGM